LSHRKLKPLPLDPAGSQVSASLLGGGTPAANSFFLWGVLQRGSHALIAEQGCAGRHQVPISARLPEPTYPTADPPPPLFLGAYKATVVEGPLNMGGQLYRIRLSETKLPKEEVGKIVRQMQSEIEGRRLHRRQGVRPSG
jgi:hypothetical protein